MFLLKQLPNATDDDLAFVESEKKYYLYKDGQWNLSNIQHPNGGTTEVNLYELNKSFYLTQELLTEEAIAEKAIKITEYHKEQKNNFYMLICKEKSYFTLFEKHIRPEFNNLSEAVIQILKENNWGIYDIYFNETTGAIEIWIKTEENEVHCMFFFAYDKGVVTYGGPF